MARPPFAMNPTNAFSIQQPNTITHRQLPGFDAKSIPGSPILSPIENLLKLPVGLDGIPQGHIGDLKQQFREQFREDLQNLHIQQSWQEIQSVQKMQEKNAEPRRQLAKRRKERNWRNMQNARDTKLCAGFFHIIIDTKSNQNKRGQKDLNLIKDQISNDSEWPGFENARYACRHLVEFGRKMLKTLINKWEVGGLNVDDEFYMDAFASLCPLFDLPDFKKYLSSKLEKFEHDKKRNSAYGRDRRKHRKRKAEAENFIACRRQMYNDRAVISDHCVCTNNSPADDTSTGECDLANTKNDPENITSLSTTERPVESPSSTRNIDHSLLQVPSINTGDMHNEMQPPGFTPAPIDNAMRPSGFTTPNPIFDRHTFNPLAHEKFIHGGRQALDSPAHQEDTGEGCTVFGYKGHSIFDCNTFNPLAHEEFIHGGRQALDSPAHREYIHEGLRMCDLPSLSAIRENIQQLPNNLGLGWLY